MVARIQPKQLPAPPGKQKRIQPSAKAKQEAREAEEHERKKVQREERAEAHRKSLFVSCYLKKPNATQAAILAGYSPNGADTTGSRLLRDAWVKEKLESAYARMQERTEVTLEKVIHELAKLGMSNMSDYVRVNGYGEPQIDLSDLDPDQWAAVSEVITETYMEGHGDDAVPVKRVKIKLHDKLGSLDKIARILGGYNGRRGSGNPGDDDIPELTTNYTLQIGNANIVIHQGAPGQGGGTEGTAAKVLALP